MSSKSLRRVSVVALAATVLVGASGGGWTEEVIKVGSPLGLTGYVASTERAWRDGLQLAADALNEKGGVLGKKIELIVEDTRSEPLGTVVAFKKMIASDGVQFFQGGCVSAGNFAAAPAVVGSETPMIMCSIPPAKPEEQKWAFSVFPPPRNEIEVRYQYLKDKTSIKKVGILYDPTPYATRMKEAGEALAKDYGLEVVAVETYKQDDADLSVQIGRINAAGAGAIVKIGFGGSTLTTAKNIKALDLKDLLLLGSFDDEVVFRETAKLLGDRFTFVLPGMLAPDTLSAEGRAALDEFYKAWKPKYGNRDATLGSRAWDSVMLMAKAIEAARTTDGPAVRTALETLPTYSGAFTSYTFTPENHVGIIKNPYLIGVVRDDKFVPVQ